jgi:hypothetical protein
MYTVHFCESTREVTHEQAPAARHAQARGGGSALGGLIFDSETLRRGGGGHLEI